LSAQSATGKRPNRWLNIFILWLRCSLLCCCVF